jgi:transcriptional regulator with XRE-family HTH domain
MAPVKRLAMRLKKLRKERGKTQEWLAKRAKISRVYLAQIEGQRQDPRLSVVLRLAKALRVKAGELLD